MKNIKKETELLFYKIHKNNASGSDYLNWAYELIEAGIESRQLFMLASMGKLENEFMYQDYFQRTLNDLKINMPEFEECARTFIVELCLEILNYSRNLFDVVKDIFNVSVELEHPLYLSKWIELDDGIDRIIYDDEHYKPNELELKKEIYIEAKNFLATQEAEDIR